MTALEKLEAEIDQLKKQYDEALGIESTYIGSGEDGYTDVNVLRASERAEELRKQIDAKVEEMKKLKEPPEGFVGVSPSKE